MLPIYGSHPRQDVRTVAHPVAFQHPGFLSTGPSLVRQRYVLLLDQLGYGRVLPILVGDLVINIVEYLAAALLYSDVLDGVMCKDGERAGTAK